MAERAALIPTYPQAEQYLLHLVNYERLPPPMTSDAQGWHLIEFSKLLALLGKPQDSYPVIHVAGTKGKGSTVRMIAALLKAIGYQKIGVFTSPHIHSFRERIAINGKSISQKDFISALNAVCAIRAPESTEGFRTTFETLTAMALWHFQEAQCDVVVLETGLGGRLDSTNAVTARVAAITAIGFEHQRVLGNTLFQIAAEKAGIIKAGTGCAVVGPQLAMRRHIVQRAAQGQADKYNVPLLVCDRQVDPILSWKPMPWGISLSLQVGHAQMSDITFQILGRHQLDNLRTALTTVEAFARLEKRPIDSKKIRRAIEGFREEGRLEVVHETPLALADGAHCPMSIRAALAACRDHFPGKKVVLVLGLMRDKNLEKILEEIAKAGNVFSIFTYTAPSPRARSAEEIASAASGVIRAESSESIHAALEKASLLARRQRGLLILGTGTIYSIAAIKKYFQN